MTRDEFVSKHTRSLLLANGMPVDVLVVDGTFIYIQKIGNYTLSKGRHSVVRKQISCKTNDDSWNRWVSLEVFIIQLNICLRMDRTNYIYS